MRLIFWDGLWVCINYLFVGWNINFLHNYQRITFPNKSCPVVYFLVQIYCIRLLDDWSFRLSHHITYICYLLHLVYSCFDIVLMTLFCTALRRDSLLRFPFFSYVQIFPGYIWFFDAYVVCIFSGHSSVQLIVVSIHRHYFLETLQSVDVISGRKGLMNSHKFSCSLVYLLQFFSRHLKNGPEYLTWWTAQVFTPLMRFLQCSLLSSRFLVLLRYTVYFFL